MTPDLSALVAILCGLFVIGTGIWYFLPEKVKNVLSFFWKLYERYNEDKNKTREPKDKK